MAPNLRKGRNPGPVDEWLDNLGYYRKNVAYDETCMFRAVSEQLHSSQIFQERIRKACIAYGREHADEFSHFVDSQADWQLHMDQLEKHMAICGPIELHLISKTFQRGITMFDGVNMTIEEYTGHEHKEKFFLCHMGEDHYDAVYYKSYILDAGFCQSITYGVLYENVFGIAKVKDIVETMLYHKPNAPSTSREENNNNGPHDRHNKRNSKMHESVMKYDGTLAIKKALGLDLLNDEAGSAAANNEYEYMLKTNLAPFPFKVAKALDPLIYRNIEYDTWTEMRKEMRLGDWYYGDSNLIEGSGCILTEYGKEYHCYIQQIIKNEDAALVFLTKKGEKRRVRLSELRAEDDAKPWPLPYRFSKHLVVPFPKLELPEKKSLRKRREERRTISKCSNTSESSSLQLVEITDNMSNLTLSAYEGTPLKMQSTDQQLQQQQSSQHECERSTEVAVVDERTQAERECAQEQQSLVTYENGWQRHEAIVWPPTPPAAQNVYAYNAVVPTTPEIIYTDPPQQAYYANDFQQPPYSVWPNGEYLAVLPPAAPHGAGLLQSPQSADVPVTPDRFNFVFSDGSNYSPNYYPTPPNNCGPNRAFQSPTSPQVDMYPQPMYQQAISTPVLLTPGDHMMSTASPQVQHLAVYSPAGMDMPCAYYQPASPFMFPPTPTQPAWYQAPAVNSQGFIFPTINLIMCPHINYVNTIYQNDDVPPSQVILEEADE